MKKLCMIFLTLVIATAMCFTTAFADDNDIPYHEHGTESGASVSEEVDVSSDKDPHISTQMFLFCSEDPVLKEVPNTGVTGPNRNMLLIATIVTGVVYLGVYKYAYEKP